MDTMTTILSVSATEISGTMSGVPYGEDRLFEIMCYNSSRDMNYYGSALVDINSIAPAVNIVLYPFSSEANVSITGTFGDVEDTEEKIVFSADWEGSNNIYMMDIDGSNIRQLTSSEYDDNYPILSPDRSKICFHRWAPEGPIGYILDVESLDLETIGLEAYRAHCFYWHPSQEHLIFHSTYYGYHDIFSYDLNTEVVTPLVRDSSISWVPSYSADGTKIIFSSDRSGLMRAYIADANGHNPVLINPDFIEEEKVPVMNPKNMNMIVYAERGSNLTTRNMQNGENYDLISVFTGKETWPRWSPDGQKIVYEHVDDTGSNIYIVNVDGSQNRILLEHDGNERYPFWR
jgi:TolB protein